MENESLLRLYLADPETDADGQEIRPFFSDAEINAFLSQYGDDLYGAASEGWRVKAGRAVELVNSTTDNSTFSLSDIHKHCMEMVEHYSSISGTVGGAELTNIKMDSRVELDEEGDEIVVG